MFQVTDMMVANSSNLIITVKPANQHTVGNHLRRDSCTRFSGVSFVGSHLSQVSQVISDDNNDDEIRHRVIEDPQNSNNAEEERWGTGAGGRGVLHL